MRLTSNRELRFEADRLTVWAAMSRVEDFPRWWPWLRQFDGTELATGSVWSCVIQPPLPYFLHVTVALDEVVPLALVSATISGDVSGTARLLLEDDGQGSRVVLTSALSPQQGMLRMVATLAPPIARFGHQWVLDTGARQFGDRAL